MTILSPLKFCPVAYCLLIAMSFAQQSHPSKVHPEGLRPGDTIMFVAPAGPLDQERMERAQKRLQALGFQVRVPDDLYRKRGYLAGSDEMRAAELMAAFSDPEVKGVFPGTGGYGVSRMLDHLDYDVIKANPKIVIGFSDITALHLALAAKTNLITFHSPVPMWGLGSPDNLSEFSARYFWRSLRADQNLDEQGFAYEAPAPSSPLVQFRPGEAQGPLIGGNLSLIVALMGTPYEIDTKGAVLFVEDVGEAPYRIDRYLSQLQLAGKLDDPAAVLLGQFTKCGAEKGKSSLTLDEVFEDYFGNAPYPVIKNFPVGHHKWNATLPIGAMVKVNADTVCVRLLENPVIDSRGRTQHAPIANMDSIALGTEKVDVATQQFGDARLLLCNLHDNENTSVTAAAQVLPTRAGRLVELRHRGTRNIVFHVGSERFECDPNRIFTASGIRRTLENLSRWDASSQHAVEIFSAKLLQVYSLDTVRAVVALHNNTEDSYSAKSYVEGQELTNDAAEVHLEDGKDTDDFFFVTEKTFFHALQAKQFNVVLQDNLAVTDDGSLSVYCGQQDITYINIEAQHGHLKEQKAMIRALFDVLAAMDQKS
jgi:muramoyltetrapeptide carboxypeptidase